MKKIICWDLDEILGDFRAFERGSTDVNARPGIRRLLKECTALDSICVVTTNATHAYAARAVQMLKAQEHIHRIFDGSMVMSWEGKRYQTVRDYFGLSEEDFSDNAIIIGDSIRDKPLDCTPAFILETTHPNRPHSLQHILRRMLKEGTVPQNYAALYETAEDKQDYRQLKIGKETLTMVYAQYPSLNGQDLTVPTIGIGE